MAARKKNTFVYADAAAELEDILSEIETGTADIDELSEKVEKAATLIRGCREALAGTELRVQKVVAELADDESESSEPSAAADDDE